MLDDADKDCPSLICPTRIACTATITEPVTSEAGDAVRLISATVAKLSGGSFQPAEIDPKQTSAVLISLPQSGWSDGHRMKGRSGGHVSAGSGRGG
jgi:hypothetical protein